MSDIQMIRNIGIFGHGKSGKTTLAEAMLFTAGKTTRLGKVDDNTSCMDFEPEEQQRKATISSSLNNYSWKKHSVYMIDTPGDDNFINDARFAATVVDGAVFTIGAVLGVKHQTVKIAEFIAENNVPAIIFITKMDRERANFDRAVNGIKESLPQHAAIIHLPIGAENAFKGVVDIVSNTAYLFDGNGKATKAEIPADMADDVEAYRESLMEAVAETDDDLIEKFLEEGELSDSELKEGLKKAIKSAQICPVLAGAPSANKGTQLLLDAINDLLPSPADTEPRQGVNPKNDEIVERAPLADQPFSAQVFKTMADPYAGRLTILRVFSGTLAGDTFYNSTKEVNEKFGQLLLMEGKESKPVSSAVPGMIVAVAKLKETTTGDTLCTSSAPIVYEKMQAVEPSISYAVWTAKKDDEDKLFSSITKMLEEDPTLRLTREPQTNEILISGVGQVHLQLIGDKIKRKFGVEMALRKPKVPYKETIKKKVEVQYKHKKQSGGRGQYAENYLEISPLPPGGGFVFEDRIVGGVIPKNYIPAIEKGVLEAMSSGINAGYPVVDVKVAVFDGSFHNVDSSEMAFKISGSMGFKKGAQDAHPVLLEPVMEMTVSMPKECVGDVIGDLNSRRGKVMGMDSKEKMEEVNVQVPMAEILEYSPDLTSITGGRGSFTAKFSHYQEVPSHLADKIIEASKEEQS
jgi:elongation factor G